jgi:hypothetical protein
MSAQNFLPFGASIAPDRGLGATCPMRHIPNAVDRGSALPHVARLQVVCVLLVPDNPIPDQDMGALARSSYVVPGTIDHFGATSYFRFKASMVINCDDYVRK